MESFKHIAAFVLFSTTAESCLILYTLHSVTVRWNLSASLVHKIYMLPNISERCVALTRQTGQVWISAALAAVFWSAPWAFFFSAAFLAFFCWDWIFCCPRAMALNANLQEQQVMKGHVRCFKLPATVLIPRCDEKVVINKTNLFSKFRQNKHVTRSTWLLKTWVNSRPNRIS